MIRSQFTLDLSAELIVDNFAGGGGASTGIELALGRHVDLCWNHDPEAVAMHEANHPQTRHFCQDVFDADPVEACAGRPVGLAWFSPDCKHFSKAKGGKPRSKKIRGLAWVVVKWAATVRPRVIILENVEEFQTWGPLRADGTPCPKRKGRTFAAWCARLRNLGYTLEWRELRACDYGAPTIRKRLFLIARCDGRPIVWPAQTHGAPDSAEVKAGRLKPWRTAAECIDWTLACPSIFERARPLAPATCRRIAKGIMRYAVHNLRPFIVRTAHGSELPKPLGTVTSTDHHSLVAAHLSKFRGTSTAQADDEPMHTVRAFLIKYYGNEKEAHQLADPIGTVTTRDRFGLVTVDGEAYTSADIGLRMLTPRELFRAQGFPEGYIIGDDGRAGLRLSKSAQVRMCGNSVCPPLAAALVRANVPELAAWQKGERRTA